MHIFHAVPIQPIKDPFTTLFKKGSTKAMRILTAIDEEEPDLVYFAATEIWKKIWSLDLDITDEEVLIDALSKSGIPLEKIEHYIARSTNPDVKTRLKDITQEGLDAGMFGAPSFILSEEGKDSQLFFGQGN